jgi:actin cytoskeleton-regulatory complex protein SLA1
MFFASESDKTPVRQWPTALIHLLESEKAKHISFDVSGTHLHFNAGSQSAAEAISAKLRSSKAASVPSPPSSPPVVVVPPESPVPEPVSAPVLKQKKSVNFAQEPPEVITSRDSEEYYESGAEEAEGISGTVLYDFAAEGEDELAVVEGETVTVIDQGNEDWWKIRNAQGMEGVVPALYVKVRLRLDALASSSRRSLATN